MFKFYPIIHQKYVAIFNMKYITSKAPSNISMHHLVHLHLPIIVKYIELLSAAREAFAGIKATLYLTKATTVGEKAEKHGRK